MGSKEAQVSEAAGGVVGHRKSSADFAIGLAAS